MHTRRLLITTAVAVLAAGGAILLAAEMTVVSVTPSSLTITQGSADEFTASIDSISGSVPARTRNVPAVTYCREWTIHAGGVVTCDANDMILLERGRNYTQSPVSATDDYRRLVKVNVDADAPCDVTYNLVETFSASSGAGIDFGADVRQVSRVVAVTVACNVATPPAFDGCSHGYWKNHEPEWPEGYEPETRLNAVFELGPFSGELATNTLSQALRFAGGNTNLEKARILLRNAVAGLLNSSTPGINYFMSTADLVSAVNAALASNDPATMLALEARLDAANRGSSFCGDATP